jgi:hypothetical protein
MWQEFPEFRTSVSKWHSDFVQILMKNIAGLIKTKLNEW